MPDHIPAMPLLFGNGDAALKNNFNYVWLTSKFDELTGADREL
jgi:hypothetical protein